MNAGGHVPGSMVARLHPIECHTLEAREFPATVEYVDSETGQLLARTVLDGVTPYTVPRFGRSFQIRMTTATGLIYHYNAIGYDALRVTNP